ncbi:ribosomal protein S6 kinase alpha-5-like isoform X1 [Scylla paramamosain]|uniref:ribosomal protein S6 kinase alpha-5-like isoform X1 n=2 Tax=Scylla paramamosain TaxID=85552 RepID=UPI003082F396
MKSVTVRKIAVTSRPPSWTRDLDRLRCLLEIELGCLAQKKVPAPFAPRISTELDVSNFSEEFTAMIPQDSPAIVPPDVEKMFNGYSYVAPSILFTDNVISDSSSLFKMSPDRRPSTTNLLLACSFKDSPFFQKYELNLRDNILGDGSFSVCRECVQKSSGQQHFPVEIVSRRLDCQQEINLLWACQGHSNIVNNLHEVFHDEAHTYIVMQLLGGGELAASEDQETREVHRGSPRASVVVRNLVSAVHYVHRKSISVHGDLKPDRGEKGWC